MKIFEMIRSLQQIAQQSGTQATVRMETGDPQTGRRVEQDIVDVLWNANRGVLLVSAEANALDPLNSLPEMPEGEFGPPV